MADDLMTMQRQAARRVQQMQEHSRRVFEAHQETLCEPEPPSTLPHLETDHAAHLPWRGGNDKLEFEAIQKVPGL